MSGRQTIDYDPVEALLDQGRRDLAAGQPEKARWCFEEVLRRRPDDARAQLGMSYVDRNSERPIGDGASILNADLAVVELVKDKRYEEAIDLLRRELLARPGDEVLEKSLKHLQRHVKRSSPPPASEPKETAGMRLPQQASSRSAPGRKPSESSASNESSASSASSESSASSASSESSASRESSASSASSEPEKSAVKPREPATVDIKRREPATVDIKRREPDTVDIKLRRAPDTVETDAALIDSAQERPKKDLRRPGQAPASSRQPSAAKGRAKAVDEAITGVRPKAPREAGDDLDLQSPQQEDLGSSGGVRLADEVPSGPALGSLPPAPSPRIEEPSSGTAFWFVLLTVVAVAVALWALRG